MNVLVMAEGDRELDMVEDDRRQRRC